MPGSTRTQLWYVDLLASGAALVALDADLGLTSEAERARAAHQGTTFGADAAHQRLATYTALRIAMERLAGPMARRTPLMEDASGKPWLPGSGIAFSLSHIDGHALVGVTTAPTIGVDLEGPREPRLPADRRARIEAAAVALGAQLEMASDVGLDGGDVRAGLDAVLADRRRFSRAWTRLEAYAKADGRGMAVLLASVGVFGPERSRGPDAHAAGLAKLKAAGADYTVADVALPGDLLGAVCLGGSSRPLPPVLTMPSTSAALRAVLG